MILQPMLANALNIEDIPKKAQGYWMEPKLDGVRCVAAWDGRMYSRSAKTALHEKLPHLSSAVRGLQLPQGVWLDGEIGYVEKRLGIWDQRVVQWPILDFNRTMRVVGSGADEAIRKQKDFEAMSFYIFDVWDEREGTGRSQAYRNGWMQPINLRLDYSVIERVPQLDAWNEDIYDDYVVNGGEGVILKNPSGIYVPGKRPTKTWYKIKKFDSFDGMIVDFDPGQGKYEGQVGALVVRHPNGQDIRCSGMNDAERQIMTKDWRLFFGKHVEVKYFGLTAGTPRHPQFLRMRPDLD